MFVKFQRRSRPYKPGQPGAKEREPHSTLVAQLVESRRVDGKPRQRVVAHLGTCNEPIEEARHRIGFYTRCDEALDRLILSAADRAKAEAQLADRIPRPTPEEVEREQRIEASFARLVGLKQPGEDGFVALVRAWNAASEDEQRRFLEELRKLPQQDQAAGG